MCSLISVGEQDSGSLKTNFSQEDSQLDLWNLFYPRGKVQITDERNH